MASKIEVAVEVKSDAEKLWKSLRESTTLFPKALPNLYQAIEVVEGDGKSAGSIRVIKYPPGLSEIASIKEKIEAVDEGGKTLTYSVVEGDMLKYYTNFKGHISVIPKGDGASSVKWWAEFDKASEEIPDPDLIRDFAIKTFQDLDAFLLAN